MLNSSNSVGFAQWEPYRNGEVEGDKKEDALTFT